MCSTCDTSHLTDTLSLATHGRGRVTPNPMVGAVVVRDGTVVGRGYHAIYGGQHAEAAALDDAGPRARGATVFCNLEPCSYEAPDKHQPPCTRRLIDAGVAEVVIGQLDPNPRVCGRGVRQLAAAGIRVRVADDDEPFWRFNDRFNTGMALDRPFVHLKTAISLDGRIATTSGHAAWITDEAARSEAHAMRSEVDGVVVGIGTVLADDPELSTRLFSGRNARPVVFDAEARIPVDSRLVRDRGRELLLLTAEEPERDAAARAAELERRGVQVLRIPVTTQPPSPNRRPRLDLPAAVRALDRVGLRSLLVEGGGTLVTAFLREGMFDRFSAFIAPIVIGAGVDAVGDLGTRRIDDAVRFDGVAWRRIGDQQLMVAHRAGWLADVRRAVAGGAGCRDREVNRVYRAG